MILKGNRLVAKQIIGASEAAESVNKYFPEVKWDRFIRETSVEPTDELDGATVVYTLYGWIDREDLYKDFVLIMFEWDGSFTYWTSSALYSEIFHERIHGDVSGHTDCERVEDWFPEIKNVVRLKK